MKGRLYKDIKVLGRKLGMSMKGWPSRKECKLISKPHPRHPQEGSQIQYKIPQSLSQFQHMPQAHSGYKLTIGASPSKLNQVGVY